MAEGGAATDSAGDGEGRHVNADVAARGIEIARDSILKAISFDQKRGGSQALQGPDEVDRAYMNAGALEPPYNPATLTMLLEHSSALRQNVDSYVTNIEAFGHHFEPVVDLESVDVNERIACYILQRRTARNPAIVESPLMQVPEPSQDDIDAAKKELKEKMRVEKNELQRFFEFCCTDISFATLRRRTRQDIEILGNGFWEVIRDGKGEVCQFDYVPGFTVRLMPLDKAPSTVKMKVKVNEFDYDEVQIKRRFRRYVQVFETRVVFFKEFGDPRIMSGKTGRTFGSVEEMQKNDSTDFEATEMLHFKVHTSRSGYGIPRWIGTLLAVLGSRQAEEVNYLYFDNKSIPPLALLVSGGHVTQETVTRIQDFIDNEIKGKANFHKILVLEAEGQANPNSLTDNGRMKIDLKPLTQAQQSDALFQNYDQANIDKVGMSFRLPRMLRGDIRDFNRSTAEAALEFAESQVFGPERDEFDFTINRKVLNTFGIRFWIFKSNAPTTRNAQDVAKMIALLSDANVLTPAEARDLTQMVFNRELKKLDAPWTRQPVQVTQAGLAPALDDESKPGLASTAATGAGSAATQAAPLGAAPNPDASGQPVAPATPPAAPGPGPARAGENVQEQVMNGAQTTSMIETVTSVANGTISRESGKQILIVSFRLSDVEADKMLGPADFRSAGVPEGQPSNTPKRAPSRGAMLDSVMELLALRKQLIKAEAAEVEGRYRDAGTDDE